MAKKKKQSIATWSFDDIGSQILRHIAAIFESLAPYRQELGSALMLVVSVLVVLNLLGFTGGTIPTALGNLAEGLFGWGAIPVIILLSGLSIYTIAQLFMEEPAELSMEKIIGIELMTLSLLVVVHFVYPTDDALTLAQHHGGGGYVGWGLGALVAGALGRWGAVAVFGVIGLAGLGLIINLSREDIQRISDTFTPSPAPEPTPEPEIPAPSVTIAPPAPPAPEPVVSPPPTPRPAVPISAPQPAMSTDQVRQSAISSPSFALPPLDLLAPATPSATRTVNARHQAEIIEETLTGFGVPAKVVEINPGPTVTQFGVKPGKIVRKMSDGTIREQRVRVSKINSLINDLALALAAAPIRIETPVPGRPIVGIEVPNSALSVVPLRGAMESKNYQNAKGKLPIALGKGVNGSVAVMDLTTQPHLLIAGATGSGKSVCINATIINLLLTHTPDELKLLMVDPKMVELTSYNGIPHLIAPVVTDFEQVAGALAWVTREMERRYKAFAKLGARNIATYNQRMPKDEKMPFMVVIIDELADLMMLAADEIERYIARIAQMARATGIHMIIATQRPSTDVVTGLIKANFPARIAFAVSSQIDSRVIIDTPGAEKLLGKGDMLYQAPDSPKLARLQGCFVSDAEIKNVVHYWKWAGGSSSGETSIGGGSTASNYGGAVSPTSPAAATSSYSPSSSAPAPPSAAAGEQERMPWADILEESKKDDMLERATKLVVETQRASTSYLQRKLGIGYPRASRLMDQLEEEGVVSPPNRQGAREVLWSPETPEEPATPEPSAAATEPVEPDVDDDFDPTEY